MFGYFCIKYRAFKNMWYDQACAHRACMEKTFSPRTSERDVQGASHTAVFSAYLSPASMAMPHNNTACLVDVTTSEGQHSPPQAPEFHTDPRPDLEEAGRQAAADARVRDNLTGRVSTGREGARSGARGIGINSVR